MVKYNLKHKKHKLFKSQTKLKKTFLTLIYLSVLLQMKRGGTRYINLSVYSNWFRKRVCSMSCSMFTARALC